MATAPEDVQLEQKRVLELRATATGASAAVPMDMVDLRTVGSGGLAAAATAAAAGSAVGSTSSSADLSGAVASLNTTGGTAGNIMNMINAARDTETARREAEKRRNAQGAAASRLEQAKKLTCGTVFFSADG